MNWAATLVTGSELRSEVPVDIDNYIGLIRDINRYCAVSPGGNDSGVRQNQSLRGVQGRDYGLRLSSRKKRQVAQSALRYYGDVQRIGFCTLRDSTGARLNGETPCCVARHSRSAQGTHGTARVHHAAWRHGIERQPVCAGHPKVAVYVQDHVRAVRNKGVDGPAATRRDERRIGNNSAIGGIERRDERLHLSGRPDREIAERLSRHYGHVRRIGGGSRWNTATALRYGEASCGISSHLGAPQ